MSRPEMITFGCRLNRYESDVMLRHAEEAGLRNAVIVNTCAVTRAAVADARRAIRRARRRRPDSRIVVTGCAVQVAPDQFQAMPEVDRILGNADKLDAEAWRGSESLVSDVSGQDAAPAHGVERLSDRTRSYVPIQTGCDHRCTFCIIPAGRGKSRSSTPQDVVGEVRRAVLAGAPEVVLTGVDLTAYGDDLEDRIPLGELVATVLREVPDLPRLRLSSIDAAEVDDRLIACFADEDRLMPHLHLSLQSADPLILKRMRRRHGPEDAVRLVTTLRKERPGMAFGADLIAGFPTETEAMFGNTLAAIGDLGIVHAHVFPYSPREGTPASRMPQVAPAERRERARRLREEGERVYREALHDRVGSWASVLVENGDGHGRSEDFFPVLVAGGTPGDIVRAEIHAANGRRLVAHVRDS